MTETHWLIATGLLVVLELTTGTFYLLMIAVGALGGAGVAFAGEPVTTQVLSAAVIGFGAVLLLHYGRKDQWSALSVGTNPDVHLDIGRPVFINGWKPDATATVEYRGARWQVRAAPDVGNAALVAGKFYIKAVDGSEFVVAP